jgi:hypothetical protein
MRTCEKCPENNAFVLVYQNVKAHISQAKIQLYARLFELQIPQRLSNSNFHLLFRTHRRIKRRRSDELLYYYANSYDDPWSFPFRQTALLCESRLFPFAYRAENPGRIYILQPFHEVPDKYIKFLRHICQAYGDLSRPNVLKAEEIASTLLKATDTKKDTTDCNIHKSLFLEIILQDKTIRVSSFPIPRKSSESRSRYSKAPSQLRKWLY